MSSLDLLFLVRGSRSQNISRFLGKTSADEDEWMYELYITIYLNPFTLSDIFKTFTTASIETPIHARSVHISYIPLFPIVSK